MPFTKGSDVKLPTHREFLRENMPTQNVTEWEIEKVMWNEKFRSITFCTALFRYSVKFESAEEFSDAKDDLHTVLDKDSYCYACITYDKALSEWTVFWDPAEEYVDRQPSRVQGFPWGMIVAMRDKPIQSSKPARKKKSAS